MSERSDTHGRLAGCQVPPPGQGTSVAPPSLTGTLGVLAPVVIALLISVFFATLFPLAFRSPTPHDFRVGITSPASASESARGRSGCGDGRAHRCCNSSQELTRGSQGISGPVYH